MTNEEKVQHWIILSDEDFFYFHIGKFIASEGRVFACSCGTVLKLKIKNRIV
jgi:hypothetical protein